MLKVCSTRLVGLVEMSPGTKECGRGDWASNHCSVIVILHKFSSEIKGEVMLHKSLKFTSTGDFYLNMRIEHVFISIPSGKLTKMAIEV